MNPAKFGDPNYIDPSDYDSKKPEIYLSPRIGISIPIGSTTLLYAHYGRFIQPPALMHLYSQSLFHLSLTVI